MSLLIDTQLGGGVFDTKIYAISVEVNHSGVMVPHWVYFSLSPRNCELIVEDLANLYVAKFGKVIIHRISLRKNHIKVTTHKSYSREDIEKFQLRKSEYAVKQQKRASPRKKMVQPSKYKLYCVVMEYEKERMYGEHLMYASFDKRLAEKYFETNKNVLDKEYTLGMIIYATKMDTFMKLFDEHQEKVITLKARRYAEYAQRERDEEKEARRREERIREREEYERRREQERRDRERQRSSRGRRDDDIRYYGMHVLRSERDYY